MRKPWRDWRGLDPQLLQPIRHRREEAQWELTVIRARAALVKARIGSGERGAGAGQS